jgi:hypothetical protein
MKEKRTGRMLGMVLLGLAASLMLAGCGGGKPEPVKTVAPVVAATQPAMTTEKKPAVSEKTVEWKADGAILDNEYSKTQMFGELEVYSRVDGDKVRMALKAKTNGYVSIGFDPSDRMKDADMVMGVVKDGKAAVADLYSTGPTGPHPPDEQQGGKNDVTVFGGSKKDGVTIIEFERKLVTGDSKDKELRVGDNKIIWAISETEDMSGRHSKRGAGVLKL